MAIFERGGLQISLSGHIQELFPDSPSLATFGMSLSRDPGHQATPRSSAHIPRTFHVPGAC